MVVLKRWTGSSTTPRQVILLYQHGNKTAISLSQISLCYQFTSEWGQVGNYIQSVCDNIAINSHELEKSAYLLHIYMHRNLNELTTFRLQRNRYSEIPPKIVAAEWQFNCKTRTRIQPAGSQ